MQLCLSQNLSAPEFLSSLAANGGKNWLTFGILMPGNTQLHIGIWLPPWTVSVCGWGPAQEDQAIFITHTHPTGSNLTGQSFRTQTRKRLVLLQSNTRAGRRSQNHSWAFIFFRLDWTKGLFFPLIKTPEPIWPQGWSKVAYHMVIRPLYYWCLRLWFYSDISLRNRDVLSADCFLESGSVRPLRLTGPWYDVNVKIIDH